MLYDVYTHPESESILEILGWLNDLNTNKLNRSAFVCGGFCYRIVSGKTIFEGDLDIFFISNSVYTEFYNIIKSKGYAMRVTAFASSFVLKLQDGKEIKIQLIKEFFSPNPWLNFDFAHLCFWLRTSSCQFVSLTENVKWHIENKKLAPTFDRNPRIDRMQKYLADGFVIDNAEFMPIIMSHMIGKYFEEVKQETSPRESNLRRLLLKYGIENEYVILSKIFKTTHTAVNSYYSRRVEAGY